MGGKSSKGQNEFAKPGNDKNDSIYMLRCETLDVNELIARQYKSSRDVRNEEINESGSTQVDNNDEINPVQNETIQTPDDQEDEDQRYGEHFKDDRRTVPILDPKKICFSLDDQEKRNFEEEDHYDTIQFRSLAKINEKDTNQKIEIHVDNLQIYDKGRENKHRSKHIEYLIEVFRPLLETRVQVAELLPNLPFLRRDESRILERNLVSKEDGIYELLNCINRNQIVGKWQSLLDALDKTDKQHLKTILKGTEEHDPCHFRKAKHIYTPEVMQQLNLKELVEQLNQNKIINAREKQRIECIAKEKCEIYVIFELLDTIPKRLCNWNDIFLKVLRKLRCSQIADGKVTFPSNVSERRSKKNAFHTGKKKKQKRTVSRKKGSSHQELSRCNRSDVTFVKTIHGPSQEPLPEDTVVSSFALVQKQECKGSPQSKESNLLVRTCREFPRRDKLDRVTTHLFQQDLAKCFEPPPLPPRLYLHDTNIPQNEISFFFNGTSSVSHDESVYDSPHFSEGNMSLTESKENEKFKRERLSYDIEEEYTYHLSLGKKERAFESWTGCDIDTSISEYETFDKEVRENGDEHIDSGENNATKLDIKGNKSLEEDDALRQTNEDAQDAGKRNMQPEYDASFSEVIDGLKKKIRNLESQITALSSQSERSSHSQNVPSVQPIPGLTIPCQMVVLPLFGNLAYVSPVQSFPQSPNLTGIPKNLSTMEEKYKDASTQVDNNDDINEELNETAQTPDVQGAKEKRYDEHFKEDRRNVLVSGSKEMCFSLGDQEKRNFEEDTTQSLTLVKTDEEDTERKTAFQELQTTDADWSLDDSAISSGTNASNECGFVCAIHAPQICGKGCEDKNRSKYIEYLIEVFRPLLATRVHVAELLPYLPFLQSDKSKILERNRLSKRDGIYELLNCIHRIQIDGKWQSLLDALNHTDNKHLKTILEGTEENDPYYNQKVLQIYTPQVMEQINLKEFIDHLYQEEVINERDKQRIENIAKEKCEIDAIFELLDTIPNRLCNWNDIFLQVLRRLGCSQIADEIEEVTFSPTNSKRRRKKKKKKHRNMSGRNGSSHQELSRRETGVATLVKKIYKTSAETLSKEDTVVSTFSPVEKQKCQDSSHSRESNPVKNNTFPSRTCKGTPKCDKPDRVITLPNQQKVAKDFEPLPLPSEQDIPQNENSCILNKTSSVSDESFYETPDVFPDDQGELTFKSANRSDKDRFEYESFDKEVGGNDTEDINAGENKTMKQDMMGNIYLEMDGALRNINRGVKDAGKRSIQGEHDASDLEDLKQKIRNLESQITALSSQQEHSSHKKCFNFQNVQPMYVPGYAMPYPTTGLPHFGYPAYAQHDSPAQCFSPSPNTTGHLPNLNTMVIPQETVFK